MSRTSEPTPRQLEILWLVAQGLTYRQVAARLCTTEKAVVQAMYLLRRLLGALSNPHAVAIAFQDGLLPMVTS